MKPCDCPRREALTKTVDFKSRLLHPLRAHYASAGGVDYRSQSRRLHIKASDHVPNYKDFYVHQRQTSQITHDA